MSEQIHSMFSRIARRYDRANRWMSFGTDQSVRRKAVRLSGAGPGDSILDCATGTGDLALLFHTAVGGHGRVTGTDFNRDMLSLAAEKAFRKGVEIEWLEQDAQALDLPDRTFDVVSIAYGIRNVDDPHRALAEMHRVLKPGGRLVVLEFGQPPGPLKPGYWVFNRFVIPLIGGLAGGDRDAYRYLQRTSDAFPYGEEFIDMLQRAGDWASIDTRRAMFGVNYIYVTTRAPDDR
ncbi:MAG: bifunctional demethylmenaquinone methyltransferase/2-methoxy-6-polyprenyl-1,4-benzoquinol methylase UbiE [Wenzhouxiangellaceae bacterium]|nr:bifunctional demethylmenaquinone methyltransferase/2-methoxy-6-polyprenyl-1,4-benzoquinol methylase UbiE [Wenzhouxiangellaceae bacterium]